MEYKLEINQLLTKLGSQLLTSRGSHSDPIEIRIQFGILLKDRFGETLGSLLGEGVGFSPPEGLSEDSLNAGLSRLEHEIDKYFSQSVSKVDAHYLLKARWACFYSALLKKNDLIIKYAEIGLKYHDVTDNTSWHRTTDQWKYLINQPESFSKAFNSLKEILKENEVQRD